MKVPRTPELEISKCWLLQPALAGPGGYQALGLERATRDWGEHPTLFPIETAVCGGYLASGISSKLDPPETGPRQSDYPWLLCPG